MIEIYRNLFVGPREDYENIVSGQPGWWVVHASKEPYHRQAVGYVRAHPKTDHPEYLFARRGNRLMLNLIDAPIAVDIPKGIFDSALRFVHEGLESGAKVLIHCEEGVSRSASIGLLYLHCHTDICEGETLLEAERNFVRIYPPFSPGKAIRYFLSSHWMEYGPRCVAPPSAKHHTE